MPIITVSCQSGSYGPEIAQKLADRLGFPIYDRKTVLKRCFKNKVSNHTYHMLEESPRYYHEVFQDELTYKAYAIQFMKEWVEAEPNAVFIGFGARHFLESFDYQAAIHIRIEASETIRTKRIQQRYDMDEAAAKSYINHWDRKFHRFVSQVFGKDLNRSDLYDVVFQTDRLSPDACIDAAHAMVMDLETRIQLQKQTRDTDRYIMDDFPELKNESEIKFAKLLDRYQIDWRYEPKSFPVEWDEQGQVTIAFRPDFYLPKFDLYLELTTMDQKYVAKKNRKARLAQEKYGINVKIVYRRDYNSVLEHHDLSAIEPIHWIKKAINTDIENHDYVVTFDTTQQSNSHS